MADQREIRVGPETGGRVMRVVMLQRIANWLPSRGFPDDVPFVTGWIDGTAPADLTGAAQLATDLTAAITDPMLRASAYLEAAAFCVAAWEQG